jgi:hypothetical protein
MRFVAGFLCLSDSVAVAPGRYGRSIGGADGNADYNRWCGAFPAPMAFRVPGC